MNTEKPTPDGDRPLIVSSVIVEADCSEWVKRISDVPIEKWTRVKVGQVIDGHATLVPVDSSTADPRHYLELELPVAGSEGEAVARVETLIAGLSAAERALGGAGLTRNPARSSAAAGTLTLVLDPMDPAGAERRLTAIALIVQAGTGFAGMPVPTRVRNGVAA
jgi:hypothetical protein